MSADQTVGEIGEQGLLAIVQRFCPADLVGDDAALLAVPPGEALVVSSDVLVDGIHFSDRTTPPQAAGWRAAAANLSDLAAMGARPIALTVSLSLPRHWPVAWVAALYRGLAACSQACGAVLAGGDLTRSPTVAIAITALGSVPTERAYRRHAAQPGDAIVATGWHGAARAGLELLLRPDVGQALDPDARDHFIRAHQYPQPRFDVSPRLAALVNSRAIAAMDSSDGLADAVLQLCRASDVGARLDRTQLPRPPEFATWLSPARALEWTLYGGEDFELVLCLPSAAAPALVEQLGNGAAIVGQIEPGSEVALATPDGSQSPQRLSLTHSFQHF